MRTPCILWFCKTYVCCTKWRGLFAADSSLVAVVAGMVAANAVPYEWLSRVDGQHTTLGQLVRHLGMDLAATVFKKAGINIVASKVRIFV